MIRHGLILYQHHSASPHPKVEVRPFLPLRLLSFPLRIMATRTDFLNARVRGSSHIDFKTAATGVAANVMRNEISRLVNTVEDPVTKRVGGVMVASYLSSSYLISASILSNHSACLVSFLIYDCGLVSSSRNFWYVSLHSDVIDDII